MSTEQEMEFEGFDCIANRAQQIYGEQEERYYGTIIPAFLGGNDPLNGIGVWESKKGMPHWHYITYGFTELYEKENDNPDCSGFGFELTFRLLKGEEEEPPTWPMNLLQNLARYVFSSGNAFGKGHHMNCNGPIALEEDTKLTALGFFIDPELGEMDTPNGHMKFLQAVAITEDEMNGQMCWDGEKFLTLLSEYIPLCITDLARDSFMKDESFYKKWEKGVEEDGSSTGFLYLDVIDFHIEDVEERKNGKIRFGAGHIEILKRLLKARIGKGKSLYLHGRELTIALEAQEQNGMGMDEDDFAVLQLNEKGLQEFLEALQPKEGMYPLKSMPIMIEIVPTEIKDPDGNVVKIIK